MGTYQLKAENREVIGKKVSAIREKSKIPAVLYGHGISNQNIAVNFKDFMKLYEQVSTSHLVDLQIADQKPVKVLIHEVQRDPVKNIFTHIDFYQIREDEKITTELPLEFKGESPAVKELGGVLVKNYDQIEIECLPKDLENIGEIVVDLSQLKNIDDAIHIKDLKLPSYIDILDSPDEVIVIVTEVKEEVEEVIKAEEPSIEEIKTVKEEEKEKEEGEEEARKGSEK